MFRRHAPLVRFFTLLLAVYVAWFVLYDLWLLPDGRLDAWLSHKVASLSAGLLSGLGFEVAHSGRVISVADAIGVEVANGCNGLTTVGLFIGFVLAFPGQWQRRLWFLPLGVGIVLVANIMRVATLALVQVHWTTSFDALHSFGATTFFYVVVFLLWIAWANVGSNRTLSRPDPAPTASSVQIA